MKMIDVTLTEMDLPQLLLRSELNKHKTLLFIIPFSLNKRANDEH